MKRTTYFCLLLVSLVMIPSSLSASTVKGKNFYAKILKPVCGFNGDVMGKKHTVSEWKQFYENNQLSLAIKVLCPQAPDITEQNDLLNLYHFLSSFASDSGNVPSCN
ncbi:hypothetical protein [Sulfurospirillum sp. MES]|uniref:hypothetical protein n=1 Tax=Sulfurospirillum sp. MES TaxID=1565314 RepID=UPI0005422198|nr:hypothetical protein [Sulfurospirillum sp. MES]KHG34689.1 MAG: hypothetical protein OA34_00550 [Sulfurospirillum sp. MES]